MPLQITINETLAQQIRNIAEKGNTTAENLIERVLQDYVIAAGEDVELL